MAQRACLACNAPTGEVMMINWEQKGDAYHATATGPDGEIRFHMMAEPNGDYWNWAAWHPGESRIAVQRGLVRTARDAMAEAELAAR
jgi:hypothetical protein